MAERGCAASSNSYINEVWVAELVTEFLDNIDRLKKGLIESNWRYRELVEAMGVTSHQPHLDIVKLIQDQASAEIELAVVKSRWPYNGRIICELDRLVAEKKGK